MAYYIEGSHIDSFYTLLSYTVGQRMSNFSAFLKKRKLSKEITNIHPKLQENNV